MDHLEGDVTDVEVHFPNGDCHCDVTVCREDEDERCTEIFHHSGRVCRNCPGIVFADYDLVPHFIDRTREEFIVRTYLPRDHQLSEFVADLREVSHHVKVLRILHNDAADVDAQTTEVDLTRLTDKQQAALQRAIEAGYYESPPAVSLAELAPEFDVSESALSQRLARAEQTVLDQLFSP